MADAKIDAQSSGPSAQELFNKFTHRRSDGRKKITDAELNRAEDVFKSSPEKLAAFQKLVATDQAKSFIKSARGLFSSKGRRITDGEVRTWISSMAQGGFTKQEIETLRVAHQLNPLFVPDIGELMPLISSFGSVPKGVSIDSSLIQELRDEDITISNPRKGASASRGDDSIVVQLSDGSSIEFVNGDKPYQVNHIAIKDGKLVQLSSESLQKIIDRVIDNEGIQRLMDFYIGGVPHHGVSYHIITTLLLQSVL